MQQLSSLYSFSPELKVLISSIKNNMGLKTYLEETEISVDNQRLLKLAKFHHIRPLLFEYNKKASLLSVKNKEDLKEFVSKNTLKNLKDIYHTKRLLQKFETAGIPAILHKGLQYQLEIYQNPQLRERGDIDILVQKKDALLASKLLKEEGFFSEEMNTASSSLDLCQQMEKLLSFKYLYQLPLKNKDLLLDFQWNINSDFHRFHFPYASIFNKVNAKEFHGIKTLQVNPESLLWLMIIHHGGKDQWMRLRHLADLSAFMKTYASQLNWEAILITARICGLHQVLLDGFLYLKTLLLIPLPAPLEKSLETHENSVYKTVFKVWEKCIWGDSRFELRGLYVRHFSQDKVKFDIGYYKRYINHLYEKKQAKALPENYTPINFVRDTLKFPLKLLRNK